MQSKNSSGGSAGSSWPGYGAVIVTCSLVVGGAVGVSLALAEGAPLAPDGPVGGWPFWFELGTCAPAARAASSSKTETCHQDRRRMSYIPSFIEAALDACN